MSSEQKDNGLQVRDILEQERGLAALKASKIKALLEERVKLAKDTEARLAAIGNELKSLGWKHPRAKAKRTQVVAQVQG